MYSLRLSTIIYSRDVQATHYTDAEPSSIFIMHCGTLWTKMKKLYFPDFTFRKKYGVNRTYLERESEKFLSHWKQLVDYEDKYSALLETEPSTLGSCFLTVLGTITSQGKRRLNI